MNMLKLMLAEDHNIVRNGIKMLLETYEEISIEAEAVNGREALDAITRGLKVDIVLADINMPEMDGIALLRELRSISPETRVVILSMLDNEQYVAQAFAEGAYGYLLKSVNSDELVFALKHVQGGAKYLCSELSIRMVNKLIHVPVEPTKPFLGAEFSIREMEVLHLLAEGLTNAQMSDKLFISKRTIEGHRQSLIQKTGSRNTASLIKFALQSGIVH